MSIIIKYLIEFECQINQCFNWRLFQITYNTGEPNNKGLNSVPNMPRKNAILSNQVRGKYFSRGKIDPNSKLCDARSAFNAL